MGSTKIYYLYSGLIMIDENICLECGLQLTPYDIESNYTSHSGTVTCVKLLIVQRDTAQELANTYMDILRKTGWLSYDALLRERDAALAKVAELRDHVKIRVDQLGAEFLKVEALQQQVTQLREALEGVEWASEDSIGRAMCPWCEYPMVAELHEDKCKLSKTLAATQPKDNTEST